MKKFKISRLIILIITIILEALPFSAVLRFSSGPEPDEIIYETFSYFSIMPLGYGHPTVIAAVLTVVLAVLIIISLYKNVGEKFYTAETVISWIAFLTSVLPVVFLTHSPLKYVIIGFIISLLLLINLIFCYFTVYNKKASFKKIIVVLLSVLALSLLILFFGFGTSDSNEPVNPEASQTAVPEATTDVLTNAEANLWALKPGDKLPAVTENPHYRDLNFNNDDMIDAEDFKLSGMSREEFKRKLVENGNLGTLGEGDYLIDGKISVPCGEVIIRY